MNQIQLLNVLSILFPGSMRVRDYTVVVDGSGNATIALWNNTIGAQPTADQLAAELAALQLQQAQAAQTAIIAQASAMAQSTGFTSSALGTPYSYPSAARTRPICALAAHIHCSLAIPVTGPLSSGVQPLPVWAPLSHTPRLSPTSRTNAQAAIMTQKSKQNTLTQQINAATTIAAVQAIVWS